MSQKTKCLTSILVVSFVLLVWAIIGKLVGSGDQLTEQNTVGCSVSSRYQVASMPDGEAGKAAASSRSLFYQKIAPTPGSVSQIEGETRSSEQSELMEALARKYRNADIARTPDRLDRRVQNIILKSSRTQPGTRPATAPSPNLARVLAQQALNEGFPAFLRKVVRKGETALSFDEISEKLTNDNPFAKALHQINEEALTKQISAPDGRELPRAGHTPEDTSGPTAPVQVAATQADTPNPPSFKFFGDIDGSHNVRMIEGNAISEGTFGLIGFGVGSFELSINPGQLAAKQSVTVGDINNDGMLDLLVADRANNIIRVFLGIGDNRYQEVAPLATIGFSLQAIKLADLNNDNNLDLILVSASIHNVAILLGNGAGGFHYFSDFRGPANPTALFVEDVNGDGLIDITLVDLSARTFGIFLGDGTGNFSAADPGPVSLTGSSIQIQDLNWNQRNSAIELIQIGHSISINANYGQGDIQNIINYTDFPNFFIGLGDFNNNGHNDLAIGRLLNLIRG